MQINTLAKDHIAFCKSKGLPIDRSRLPFLIERIKIEIREVETAQADNVQEELVDVLLQTIKALAVIDPDIESAIKKKIIINKGRTWN